jgi:transcriptional regulator of acetoin/glycerol metabolism
VSTDPELTSLGEVERKHVRQVLAQVKGNKQEAARILGIGRSTLYRMLGIDLNL